MTIFALRLRFCSPREIREINRSQTFLVLQYTFKKFSNIKVYTNAQKIRNLEAINQKLSIDQITHVIKITTNYLCNIRKWLNIASDVT